MYDFNLLTRMWRERVERQDAERRSNIAIISAITAIVIVLTVGLFAPIL